MSADHDSVAARSFADALRLLHHLEIPSPRMSPPLQPPATPDALRHPPVGKRPAATTRRGQTVAAARPVPVLTKAPTVTEALTLLREGRCSTRGLVEGALEVAAGTGHLGAVVALDEDQVRVEADRLDRERVTGHLRGPLHGIPVTVKDIIDVEGLPTGAGSAAYDDPHPADAEPIALLRKAGALLLAKVATHEFALGVATPQCRNPHDPARLAGGSSGGSAIAVATGIGLASIGTDTRASLRVPAHCCGVVGFKPTFGRVPAGGIVPLSWTIDHVGPVTRTVADVVPVLNVLAGGPFLEPGAGRSSPPTVGLVAEVFGDADPDVAVACEAALSVLERLGCRLVEVSGPSLDDLEASNALGLLVSRSEAATYHRSRGTDLDRCIPEVRDQLRAAMDISAVDYLDAQRQRVLLSTRTLAQFRQCDVVVSPTAPIVAPAVSDYERHLLRLSRNTIIWSLAGAPALSMPCGATASGVPIGLQLAAAPGNEQVLVSLGMAFEEALGSR